MSRSHDLRALMGRRPGPAVAAAGGASVAVVVAVAVAVARRRRPGHPEAALGGAGDGAIDATLSRPPVAADDLFRLPEGSSTTVTASDGARLAVAEAGSGPVVVLCHGWTETSGVWATVARHLVEAGVRVVLFDQRGHGGSTVGADGITMARLGRDLADVLTALDLRDVVLVGHSMGGMTIMALQGDEPEVIDQRARALVLVSTAAAGLGRNRRVDGAVARLMATPLATRALVGRPGEMAVRATMGRHPVAGHLAATAALWVATEGGTRRDCYVAMTGMDLRAGLAAVRIPVTVVVGRWDVLTPPRLARDLVAHTPGAELVVIADAGHQLPLEAPERLAELITAAVGSKERPSPARQ